jgi:hypothetical protein
MTLKRINTETIFYHYFEFHNSKGQIKYALYDADMDMPIAYGSRNFVHNAIRNLPKNVTVIYYKPDADKITFYNPRFQKYIGKNETPQK